MGPSPDTSSLTTTEPAMTVNDGTCQAALTALGLGSLFLFRLLRRAQATPGGLFEAAFAPWFITKGLAPATTATSVAEGR